MSVKFFGIDDRLRFSITEVQEFYDSWKQSSSSNTYREIGDFSHLSFMNSQICIIGTSMYRAHLQFLSASAELP